MPGRLTCPANFMSYLYILKNRLGRHYIGITKLEPRERLKRHNQGDVYSTKSGRSWKIICLEKFETLKEAREMEKMIKRWKGGNAFKKFLCKTAGSSNGRTTDSGSVYLGSNPSPAVLQKNKI